jgi:hypothetical protein
LAKLTCQTEDSEDYTTATTTGTSTSSNAIEWADVDDDSATSAAGVSPTSGESTAPGNLIVQLPPEVLCGSTSSKTGSSSGGAGAAAATAYDDSILLHNETGLELAVRTSDLPQHELVVPPQAKAALAFEQVR